MELPGLTGAGGKARDQRGLSRVGGGHASGTGGAGGDTGGVCGVKVSGDGARVSFVRSQQLWVFDVGTAQERLVVAAADLGGADLTAYSIDQGGRVATLAVGSGIAVVDLVAGGATMYPGAGTAVDPRPDPTGRRVAYVTHGALRVIDLATGADELLAAETRTDDITWGLPEPIAAADFGRRRGYWWSPDGTSVLVARVDTSRMQRWYAHQPATPARPPRAVAYPAAGAAHAEVTLHLLDLDGGWVDVHWDREIYPYLVDVSWVDSGGPIATVLRRLQQHGLVLAIDPRTGETQVHTEQSESRWIEPIPGTPRRLPDGRVLIGLEIAHDGSDIRILFADGCALTMEPLYIRRVCGLLGADLVVEVSDGEPSQQHLYRVLARSTMAGLEFRRLTTEPGWHIGHPGGETLAMGTASLEHDGTLWTIQHRGVTVGRLQPTVDTTSGAAAAPPPPRPVLERVTDRRLPTGVVYPRTHVTGRRLPVLVDVGPGPGTQGVVAARTAWLDRQWWADTGFAVVSIDGRGTPGVAPLFEKAVHRRLADVVLADLVDALTALADKHPDLDLTRVAVRGQHLGGWLAVLALLRRPDICRCAVARAPITDWSLHSATCAERYLGSPDEASDIYAHHCLVALAAEPVPTSEEARPLLLIHDLADEEITSAHTVRLSAALLHAGRPHALLPVTAGSPLPTDSPFAAGFPFTAGSPFASPHRAAAPRETGSSRLTDLLRVAGPPRMAGSRPANLSGADRFEAFDALAGAAVAYDRRNDLEADLRRAELDFLRRNLPARLS